MCANNSYETQEDGETSSNVHTTPGALFTATKDNTDHCADLTVPGNDQLLTTFTFSTKTGKYSSQPRCHSRG